MMMNREQKLAVGDWVRGKTKQGELIHGFVENVDSTGSTVHVYVVNSDNDMALGKVVATRASWVEAMAKTSLIDEEQVYDLIDLALATKDREWFMELSAMAASWKKNEKAGKNRSAEQRHVRNRLGTSAIWE